MTMGPRRSVGLERSVRATRAGRFIADASAFVVASVLGPGRGATAEVAADPSFDVSAGYLVIDRPLHNPAPTSLQVGGLVTVGWRR
jgi:hypothetical protein